MPSFVILRRIVVPAAHLHEASCNFCVQRLTTMKNYARCFCSPHNPPQWVGAAVNR